LHGVDLSSLTGPGGQVRFLLLAVDVAGNLNVAGSGAVARDASPAQGVVTPPAPPAPALTPPAAAPALASPAIASLPNLAKVRSVGLTSPQAGRPAVVRGVRVLVVLARGAAVV